MSHVAILFYIFLPYTIVVFLVLIQLLLLHEINHYLFIIYYVQYGSQCMHDCLNTSAIVLSWGQ